MQHGGPGRLAYNPTRRLTELQKGDVVQLQSGARYLVDPVTGQWRKLPKEMEIPVGVRVVKRGV